MSGPLDGIRIVDWTIWQQGPVATQMLADLGAEVIKIEERERGDPGRGITAIAGSGTGKSGRNYYFEANNKHKKSIALNLKQPEAREIVHRLAARSDVFVQNFRKGVAAPARAWLCGPCRVTTRGSSMRARRATAPKVPTAANRRSIIWGRRGRES